jgi:hypothetical protein
MQLRIIIEETIGTDWKQKYKMVDVNSAMYIAVTLHINRLNSNQKVEMKMKTSSSLFTREAFKVWRLN